MSNQEAFENWWDDPNTSIDYDDVKVTAYAAWQAASSTKRDVERELQITRRALEMACSMNPVTLLARAEAAIAKAESQPEASTVTRKEGR